MPEDIYILGIGRNSVNIIELALDCGYNISGLIHFDESLTGQKYCGFKIIGSFKELLIPEFISNKNVALSMGNIPIKKRIYDQLKKLNAIVPSLVHPTCIISRFAKIGEGVQILPGSIIEGDSEIGENTSITVNSVIAHNVKIGTDNLISGNCMVGAYSSIGNSTHIGQGSTIVSGKVKSIGDNCILGAGSVLVSDMPSNSIFVGNPAKFLKDNN